MIDAFTVRAAAPEAAAATSGVSFMANSRGATLEIAWKNNTSGPLKIATHVFAGEKHFERFFLRDQALRSPHGSPFS